MIRSLITSVCALLIFSTATAQFTCSLHSVDESGCDAAKAEDGSGCVWCSWSTYGVCVAEDQASQMKQILPVTCDDDGSGGDDDDDDDVAPASDDDIPDDSVFACLKKENDGACGKASCVWCDTKGGFGVCLTEEAAAGFAKDSYWFDCDATEEDKQASNNDIQDPLDTACILAGFAGDNDEAVCVAAADSDGNACDFCTITDGVDLCLNDEQAQIASLVGGSCGATNDSAGAGAGASLMELQDPYDTACVMVQVTGGNDGAACVSAADSDGYGCEWCALSNGLNFCLTSEQASIAEVIGSSCENGSGSSGSAASIIEKKEGDVQDPADTACLMAGLAGGNDESACVAAADSDGNACEFCSINNGLAFCLNAEQAQIAALVFFTCDSNNVSEGVDVAPMIEKEEDTSVQDPADTACLLVGLAGGNDESVCVAAADSDGNACEFCSIGNGLDFCLNAEQAQIAALVGGTCDSNNASAGVGASLMDLKDPYDTACLMAQIASGGNDESACESVDDTDGFGCEWCSFSNGYNFCLTSEQASIAEVAGGVCKNGSNTEAGVGAVSLNEKKEDDVQDPADTACLLAGLTGGNDKSACVAAADSDGNACEFCSISNGLAFCLNAEQAQIAALVGGTCDSTNALVGADAAVAFKKSLRN